jgi:predicted ABC-type ATPase
VAAERPLCLCLAGANGSGKSTLAPTLRDRFSLEYWIDPDEIAKSIAHRRGERITDTISQQAFRQARNARCSYASRLESFGFETVFSHGSNLAFLRALKEVGYRTELIYLSTDNVEINVTRVHNRVEEGGHDVPEPKIRERYGKSLLLLTLAVRNCNRLVLFDNSRPLSLVGSTELAGRLAGEIHNDISLERGREILLLPPIPRWLMTYALDPYTLLWQTTDLFRLATDTFGNDVHFTAGTDLHTLQGRERFFTQFRFQLDDSSH